MVLEKNLSYAEKQDLSVCWPGAAFRADQCGLQSRKGQGRQRPAGEVLATLSRPDSC